ncbi:MAG: DNA-binding protein [Candidatus Omnitrophica bacterium]|nr:DNA-binding protein [Candidatus Omnitrophota bacterium]
MLKSKIQILPNPKQIHPPSAEEIGIYLVVLVLLVVLGFVNNGYTQSISSTELINHAKDYDGKEVTYAGEVIGEVMCRGDFAWINLNDGQGAIGVWVDKALSAEIHFAGSYQAKGDWVEVSGIFQRACPEHGGDLDIHARELKKITPGYLVNHGMDPERKKLVFILLAILGAAWILQQLKRR